MGTKGFAIFSLGISTFFLPISLKMLEVLTTSLGFPSWVGDIIYVISLLVVTASLLFFFFFSTNKIALTSTIIFSFLFWVFVLVPLDSSFFDSHYFKK
jgi:hypothetical protein